MDERVSQIINNAVALEAKSQAKSTAAAPHSERGAIAGFWIRVAADALDAVILFAVGWVLSFPFHSTFARLGERGVFIGLAISMAYTGVLQSRFGGGRTLGKRLLGLRVVRLDGTLLSLDRSLVRYALMGLLVYQGAVAYAVAAVFPFVPLAWVQTTFNGIAGALFVGCVLVVPFHPLKRGLHDILAGTIVVRRGLPDPGFVVGRTNARRDRRIVIGAAVLALVGIVGSAGVSRQLLASTQMKPLLAISQRLQDAGVSNVGVVHTTSWSNGGPATVTIVASGFVPRPAEGGEPAWGKLATVFEQAVKAELPPDSGVDRIETELRTGFNIGIYKSYETRISIEDARTGDILQSQTLWNW
jgi:uncharacterized RDD family membrane protein YckC